ncbi:hypothetical protein MUO14_03235 [Halobacillus shinanisalinarum]|uniref:Uncharacterized protein n=1 Tax=Halobacillus shinanisalinarum TaxID=2932258 RepID=A0ABY4H4V1_9BACI|nr:hypothetical protein [Halobacillus shinanisalinarum]UOQ93997.1 hypothetical protein MUO14_03235 [Halobacillus shinanisalinarum]
MKVRQFPYILVIMAIFSFMIYPSQAFADSKYPVRITNQTMVVFPVDENTIQVVQSMSFKNNGKQKEEKLPIYLPEDYADLQLGEGLTEENIEKTAKGIIDKTGLDGGKEKQLVVFYKMPMFNSSSQFAIEQSYVTEKVQVAIQTGVLSFTASELLPQSELFEMNGKEFRRFTHVDVHPGEPWTLSFRLLNTSTQSPSEEGEQNNANKPGAKYTEDGLKIIGNDGFGYGKAAFTIVIIIVALAAALLGLKRDLLKTTGDHRKVKRSWLVDEKEMLFEEIIQLERDYQSNLITEGTYEKTKEKTREHLVRVTMELNKGSQG